MYLLYWRTLFFSEHLKLIQLTRIVNQSGILFEFYFFFNNIQIEVKQLRSLSVRKMLQNYTFIIIIERIFKQFYQDVLLCEDSPRLQLLFEVNELSIHSFE